MSEQQTPRPRMVRIGVIESIALFQLEFHLENVDFADLLGWKKLLKFEIVVSRVSWMEFLRKRKAQVSDCIDRIKQLRSSLEKLGQRHDELKAIEDRVTDLDKNLKAVFEKKLATLEIGILSLAKDDLELLVGMTSKTITLF